MNNNTKSRSFLTEFIIVILFFSIVSVIIIQVFVNASKKSRESERLTMFQSIAMSIDETIGTINFEYDNPLETKSLDKTLEEYKFIVQNGNTYVSNLDSDFEFCSANAQYKINVEFTVNETMSYSKTINYTINFYSCDDKCYSLKSSRVIIKGGSTNE